MYKLTGAFLMISVLLFSSCGEDEVTAPANEVVEPIVDHIVGEWEIDGALLIGIDTSFSRYLDSIRPSVSAVLGFDTENHILKFNEDKTFLETIVRPAGQIDLQFEGTWNVDTAEKDDELDELFISKMIASNTVNTDFLINTNKNDRLEITETRISSFVPNSVFDTIPDILDLLASDTISDTEKSKYTVPESYGVFFAYNRRRN